MSLVFGFFGPFGFFGGCLLRITFAPPPPALLDTRKTAERPRALWACASCAREVATSVSLRSIPAAAPVMMAEKRSNQLAQLTKVDSFSQQAGTRFPFRDTLHTPISSSAVARIAGKQQTHTQLSPRGVTAAGEPKPPPAHRMLFCVGLLNKNIRVFSRSLLTVRRNLSRVSGESGHFWRTSAP